MSHVRTLEAVIHQVRIPFRPKHDPSRKLAEEIESCKRKIWQCIDPGDRKHYLEKKQKKINKNNVKLESDKENSKHATNLVVSKSAELKIVQKPPEVKKTQPLAVTVVQKFVQKTAQKSDESNAPPSIEVVQKPEEEKSQAPLTRTDVEFKVLVMKVAELKKELKSRGRDTSGLKKDLRARLINVMMEQVERDQTQTLPVVNKQILNSAPETIEESNEENDQSMEASEEKGKVVEQKVPQPQSKATDNCQPDPQQNESTTSMEVEQHNHIDEPVKETKKEQENERKKKSVPCEVSTEKKPEQCQSSANAVPEESFKQTEKSLSSIKEIGVTSPNETTECPRKSEGKKSVSLTETKMQEFSESQDDDAKSDEPVPTTSEVSYTSKASGMSVKDMVSKFSGFTTNHSNNNGSALSKGLQAKKEARQAKIAEMRAKAQNKPASSTKVALTSKEYSTTLSSLNATASTASATKKNLATQMREKAAARFQNKLTNTSSKTTTAPSNKRHLPLTNNSNHSNNIIPDPLGATIKQDPLGATIKQDPLGATIKQDPLGATLKQAPLGATLKQAPLVKKEAMSPMDTYEISDREDSETDDSDSDSDDDKAKKKIPTWAQRSNLYSALEEQYNGRIGGKKVDPDEIFPEVHSCDLEAIFGQRKSKNYRSRASSGNWANDKVTVAEKLVYKREMGFATKADSTER